MNAALLVGFYEDPALARMQEFITCLERNLANEHIGEIHLFLEEEGDGRRFAAAYGVLRHSKLRMVPHGRRTTYRALFDHANRNLAGRRSIIANADIYFDHTLQRLDGVDLAGKLACLSRWDVLNDGTLQFFDHPSSQDAWIFEAPVPPMACDFHLGMLGCDNRLAWEAQAVGLTVFNPGRSVRACHLHRSLVRRYTERERLFGPVLSIASSTLGTPWLSFIVPCMGRLAELRSTIDSLIGQRRSTCYVVDYSCPDGTGNWMHALHPEVTMVSVPGRRRYHAAEARNRGAQAADEDAILCFLEADMAVAPDFSERVLTELPANGYMIFRDSDAKDEAVFICRKGDFLRAGGYDEVLLDPGEDHSDLAHRLRLSGLAEHPSSAALLSPRHTAPMRQDWALGDAAMSATIQASYRRVKAAILEEAGTHSQTVATLRRIYRDVARRRLGERGLAPTLPDAQVAFSEDMGYVVAQLVPGVSSHTNLARPLAEIPARLAGKAFTQVVAYQAAPVEVEFLSAGKLYVLVGTDWYGYLPTVAWLASTGYREPFAALTTTLGTTFEVWSVVGDAGEKLVIPTQAMLVADELRRRA